MADDPSHAPDGQFFRTGPVSVLDAAQRPIHHGVEPESKIIELMNRALAILGDSNISVLVRVSVFHFMFACIHPFYDGNGRQITLSAVMCFRTALIRSLGITCHIQ